MAMAMAMAVCGSGGGGGRECLLDRVHRHGFPHPTPTHSPGACHAQTLHGGRCAICVGVWSGGVGRLFGLWLELVPLICVCWWASEFSKSAFIAPFDWASERKRSLAGNCAVGQRFSMSVGFGGLWRLFSNGSNNELSETRSSDVL